MPESGGAPGAEKGAEKGAGRDADRPTPDALKRSLDREAFSGEALNGEALNGEALGKQFLSTVHKAAQQAGCELLFEIPSALFQDPAGRSAAMRFGGHGEAELFFILFNAANGAIRVMEEGEVPAIVLDFTRSYAGVLGLIAVDRKLTAPLLQ